MADLSITWLRVDESAPKEATFLCFSKIMEQMCPFFSSILAISSLRWLVWDFTALFLVESNIWLLEEKHEGKERAKVEKYY